MYTLIAPCDKAIRGLVKSHMHLKGYKDLSSTQEQPYNQLMAITILLHCVYLYEKGYVRPCLCLVIMNMVPFIGASLGFEMLSKSCDCGQQYTHIMLLRVPFTHRVANTLGDLQHSGCTRGRGSSILVLTARIPHTW